MSDAELVDGDGWISDESSFYGDAKVQTRLEEEVSRPLKRPYSFPANHVRKKVKSELVANAKQEAKAEPQSEKDVLSFLKSRPQIAGLHKAAAGDRKPTKEEIGRSAAGEEAADLLEDNHFEGDPATWQQSETINDFLKRAPVADPATASLGPWLWVSNPKISWSHRKHEQKADIAAFEEGGHILLTAFGVQKERVESENPNALPTTITRKMRPYREQLEDDLLTLAVKTGTTCGKWMLFPTLEDYPRYWRLVAEATSEGKLGITSKAATHNPMDPLALICVYTFDFTDSDDVRKVLEGLVDLGVCQSDGRPIFYKCDAYTYLGIKSENLYRIKPSLYSSKDILNKEAKAIESGPIMRLKKRNQTMHSFFSS